MKYAVMASITTMSVTIEIKKMEMGALNSAK